MVFPKIKIMLGFLFTCVGQAKQVTNKNVNQSTPIGGIWAFKLFWSHLAATVRIVSAEPPQPRGNHSKKTGRLSRLSPLKQLMLSLAWTKLCITMGFNVTFSHLCIMHFQLHSPSVTLCLLKKWFCCFSHLLVFIYRFTMLGITLRASCAVGKEPSTVIVKMNIFMG